MFLYATLADANGNIIRGFRHRTKTAQSDCQRPEVTPKICLAMPDHRLSDAGLGTHAIMAAAGKSKTCVWRWQERFMAEGVDGLLYDKTPPPGTPPIEAHQVQEIVH